MNWKTLQFVSGFMLLVVGIRWLTFDISDYLVGAGFVIWGLSSIFQAWFAKNNKNENVTAIFIIIGSIMATTGFILRNPK